MTGVRPKSWAWASGPRSASGGPDARAGRHLAGGRATDRRGRRGCRAGPRSAGAGCVSCRPRSPVPPGRPCRRRYRTAARDPLSMARSHRHGGRAQCGLPKGGNRRKGRVQDALCGYRQAAGRRRHGKAARPKWGTARSSRSSSVCDVLGVRDVARGWSAVGGAIHLHDVLQDGCRQARNAPGRCRGYVCADAGATVSPGFLPPRPRWLRCDPSHRRNYRGARDSYPR